MKHLKVAIRDCFEGISTGRLEAFTGMVQRSISHCRILSRSVTSGSKTANSAMRVIKVLWSQKSKRAVKRHLAKTSFLSSQGSRAVQSSQGSVVAIEVGYPSPVEIEIVSSQESVLPQASSSSAADVLAKYASFSSNTNATSSSSAGAKPAVATPKKISYNTPNGLVRFTPDGEKEVARMSPGPKGFALAQFPGSPTQHETEQTNLSLPDIVPDTPSCPLARTLRTTSLPPWSPQFPLRPHSRPIVSCSTRLPEAGASASVLVRRSRSCTSARRMTPRPGSRRLQTWPLDCWRTASVSRPSRLQ